MDFTKRQLKDLGLWEKVCQYKGLDSLEAERLEERELIELEDSFLNELKTKTTELHFNKSESITLLDMIKDCFDRGIISGEYDIDKIKKLISNSEDAFENWTWEDCEITIKLKSKF